MAVDEVATPKKKGGEVVPAGAAALVEFAVPIADEKNSKKVLKGVRKGEFSPTATTSPSSTKQKQKKKKKPFCLPPPAHHFLSWSDTLY